MTNISSVKGAIQTMGSVITHLDEHGVCREYAKVTRRANVGELVLIVERASHAFNVGDITTIVEIGPRHVRGNHIRGWMCDSRYVTLEPTGAIYYEARRYTTETRPAQKNDYVLIVAPWCTTGQYEKGSVLHVKDVFGGTGGIHVYGVTICISGSEYAVLVPTPLKPYIAEAQPERSPSDQERIIALEQRVATLEETLKTAEVKKPSETTIACNLSTITVRSLEESLRTLLTTRPPLSRDEVVEKAKKALVELLSDEYYLVNGRASCTARYNIDYAANTVTCELVGNFTRCVRAMGKAKCADGECFNVHIGKAIALYRALDKPVPSYLTTATQPTTAQVGDIIELDSWREWNSTIVKKRLVVTASNNDTKYGHGCTIGSINASIGKIVDDSRDGFGGGQR